MKRIWYWPAWKMTEPLKVGTSRGGDEFLRSTTCLHLGPLGVFVYASEDDAWYERITEATQMYLIATDFPISDEEQAVIDAKASPWDSDDWKAAKQRLENQRSTGEGGKDE